ncbi:hypothetical protein [Rhizobium leguminosarum]|uniref:hypothetical protein n=1 Tax=Rhizobium leguminosarum TaxID=384 RepID=UPI002E1002EF|nr:hypothetical protein U8Q02_37145 [Rhizobium leguminosarum]
MGRAENMAAYAARIKEQKMAEDVNWGKLLDTVSEIQKWFPEGVAFIGGIAVHAYLEHSGEYAKYAAQSHDADFVIRVADMADLRDIEALTPNNRLNKQQFVKNGFEFDVYVEGQHNLPVDTADAIVYSVERNGLRVVCPEHLLKMKVFAYNDRKGSVKGDKDEADIARVFLTLNEVSEAACELDEDDLEVIHEILKGNVYRRLTDNNDFEARQLKTVCLDNFEGLRRHLGYR